MRSSIVIGSRGSDLALWQANFVKQRLESLTPDVTFEIKIVVTTGDQMVDVALSKIGDKGLFTRQIETELLNGEIDLAVHSLKDLQTLQPDGLKIAAVCEREAPNDALISRESLRLAELPVGSNVATGSLRRRSQLMSLRPDLVIHEIRGNVPTRLAKFEGSGLDAMVLAYAGLHRLGLDDKISEVISADTMIPAVGQGAVAIETRDADDRISQIVAKLDHPATRCCIEAERAFLRRLEGGCQVPIGGYATVSDGTLHLTGYVGSTDGTVAFRESATGHGDSPRELGLELAERLIARGAERVLDAAREQTATAEPGK